MWAMVLSIWTVWLHSQELDSLVAFDPQLFDIGDDVIF